MSRLSSLAKTAWHESAQPKSRSFTTKEARIPSCKMARLLFKMAVLQANETPFILGCTVDRNKLFVKIFSRLKMQRVE
jgi:hypothetical protein